MRNRWLTAVVSCLRYVSAVPSSSWPRSPRTAACRDTTRCAWPELSARRSGPWSRRDRAWKLASGYRNLSYRDRYEKETKGTPHMGLGEPGGTWGWTAWR